MRPEDGGAPGKNLGSPVVTVAVSILSHGLMSLYDLDDL